MASTVEPPFLNPNGASQTQVLLSQRATTLIRLLLLVLLILL